MQQNLHSKFATSFVNGLGQLSLVEHSLCPLDCRVSLRSNLVHETEYSYCDKSRRMQQAHVRVMCPLGLSAQDEFYLWGLLALALRQPQPTAEFHATPHYCLRQLGIIDAGHRRGGRQYQQFANAVERLSVVNYLNDRFFDPVRAEHRRVSFGFFSYSLPMEDESSRAWRFYFDQAFFQFIQAAGGALAFDLTIYRRLDPASRRLFLLASKVFPRRESLSLNLKHLAVNVLGLSPHLIARDKLAKTRRCLQRLADHRIVAPESVSAINKRSRGEYDVRLTRGAYYERRRYATVDHVESPMAEGLTELGLDSATVARVLRKYRHAVLREWLDITLAAKERFGMSFFKRSPAAYFLDNVKHASAGQRTPPDWWHEVRKAEELRRADQFRRSLGRTNGESRDKTSKQTKGHLTPVSEILAQIPFKQ